MGTLNVHIPHSLSARSRSCHQPSTYTPGHFNNRKIQLLLVVIKDYESAFDAVTLIQIS